MSTVVIKINDVDITDDVFISDASFTSLVNGQPGPASIRVKDNDQTYEFTSGGSLTLDIDGNRVWGGYVMRALKTYPLLQDTTDAGSLPRVWQITGVDYNILFTKRIVYKLSDPADKVSWSYDASTYDDTIINDIFDNYLEIGGDDLTRTGVERIAHAILDVPGKVHSGSVASAGYTWKQFMDRIARETGGVYYISPEKVLFYVDVEEATLDYYLGDSDAVTPALLFSDDFNRTVSDGWGNGWDTDGDDDEADVDGDHALVQSDNWIYPLTNPAIPDVEDFDLYVDWKIQAIPSSDAGFNSYIYFELGSSWFDGFVDCSSSSTSPLDLELEVGSNGVAGHTDITIGAVADSWVTIRWAQFGGNTYLKVWPRGDPEPDDWLIDHAIGSHTTPAFELDGPHEEPGMMDNLRIYEATSEPPEGTRVGYQGFSLMDDGTKLINDMFVWGSALGSDHIVFSRSTDSASVAEHGVRQAGLFSGGLYRQASTDIVADSYVYGTPESHRGGKDPNVTFQCRVFEPVFQAGQVVNVVVNIYGYSDALPIRSMKTTFASPTDPIFDLVLGHEVNDPVGIFEYKDAKPYKPPRDDGGGDPPPPSDPPDPDDCGCDAIIIDDDFDRTVVDGWDSEWLTSDQDFWDSDPTQFSVDGAVATIIGRAVTPPYPDDPWIFWDNHSISFDDELLIKFRVNDSSAGLLDFSFYLYSTVANDWSSVQVYKDGTDLVCIPVHASAGASDDNGPTVFSSGWDGEWIWCRMRSTPFQTDAKFWLDGDTEPSTWLFNRRGYPIASGPLQFVIGVINTSSGSDYSVDFGSVLLTTDRCSAVQFDAFARTVPSGWGSSMNGNAWTLNPGGGTASVDSSGGHMEADSGDATDLYIASTGPWSGNFVMTTIIQFETSPATGTTRFTQAVGQFEESQVHINWGLGGAAVIGVEGAATDDDAVVTIEIGSQDMVLEWEHTSTVSRARVYPQGDTPPGWQVTRDPSGDSIGTPEFSTTLYNNLGGTGTQSLTVRSIDFDYEGRPCYTDCTDVLVLDTFEGRTVANNWGTSTSGIAWDSASPTAKRSVAGGYGIFDLLGAGFDSVTSSIDFPAPLSYPLEVHLKFRVNRDKTAVPTRAGPATGNNNSIVGMVWQDIGTGLDFRFALYHRQQTTPLTYFTNWSFIQVAAGSTITSQPNVAASEDVVADTWYEVKMRASPGEALMAKLWQPSNAEPAYTVSTVIFDSGMPATTMYFSAANPIDASGTSDLYVEYEFVNITTCSAVDPPAGIPDSGDVCETITHSGGNDFATRRAFFSGSLKVWVNGTRITAFTFDAALGEFHLTTGISGSDELYVCYRANGDPS